MSGKKHPTPIKVDLTEPPGVTLFPTPSYYIGIIKNANSKLSDLLYGLELIFNEYGSVEVTKVEPSLWNGLAAILLGTDVHTDGIFNAVKKLEKMMVGEVSNA